MSVATRFVPTGSARLDEGDDLASVLAAMDAAEDAGLLRSK